ncbi:MAG: N-acetyltransferase [Melioribacteraceae bacterium]|nr:N-acetyltransferase [Melioribacteraceae bacterium]
MGLEVKEISSLRDIKRFVDFQYSLYKNNQNYVPPPRSEEIASLRKDKNPAFDFCESKYWLVYKDKKIVGRIAGIINQKYNTKWIKKEARFGWIDFIDDENVSALLLKTVEDWAKSKDMTSIHGPLGFTDMDGEGTLIEGFNELSILGSIYNYEYYPKHIEKMGYEKDTDWLEFQVTIDKREVPDKVARIADIALKRNKLKLLKVKKAKEMLPYAREIFYLINEAYKDLYGFVELSDKQIDMYVKQYFGFIIPEYVPVVLDENNKVAAFGITMPSLSKAFQKNKGRLFPFGFIHILSALKNNNIMDLYLTAVRPDLQDKGVNAILMNEINKLLIKKNITTVETNRELESNLKVQSQWKFYTTRQHKRRRCYKKEL